MFGFGAVVDTELELDDSVFVTIINRGYRVWMNSSSGDSSTYSRL
jgi:hypothetical protein